MHHDTLLTMVLIFQMMVFSLLAISVYFLYALFKLLRRPRQIYTNMTHKSLPMHRKDFDVPLVKYALVKVAVFVAIRMIAKRIK